MSPIAILKAGKSIPFKYETKSPYAKPILHGLRHAVAVLRQHGRHAEYSIKLEHGFFVYYVRIPQTN